MWVHEEDEFRIALAECPVPEAQRTLGPRPRVATIHLTFMFRNRDRGVLLPSANAETCASLRRRMLTLPPLFAAAADAGNPTFFYGRCGRPANPGAPGAANAPTAIFPAQIGIQIPLACIQDFLRKFKFSNYKPLRV